MYKENQQLSIDKKKLKDIKFYNALCCITKLKILRHSINRFFWTCYFMNGEKFFGEFYSTSTWFLQLGECCYQIDVDKCHHPI